MAKTQQTMRLDEIRVGDRFRKDLGDLEPLKQSILDHGLLHPVVVDESGGLIAGQRRLEAYRLLGRDDIPVTRLLLKDLRAGERDENLVRLDLLPTEAVAVVDYFRAKVEAEAKAAQKAGGRQRGRGQVASGKLPQATEAKTRDILGAKVGMSGRTLEKVEAVVAAAQANPELVPLVEEMDRTRRVDGPYRKLRRMQDEKRRVAIEPVKDKYRTIVIDPPWKYDADLAGRAKPEYALMTLDEIQALPVAEWADTECHLYLWTTNTFILQAGGLLEGWGFEFKTVLTWIKPRFGMGSYFRSSTEHCLFAVKGKAPTRAHNIPTHFEAPLGKHSEKPDALYDIAERSSYAPRLDAFARKERDGWTAWGAGV